MMKNFQWLRRSGWMLPALSALGILTAGSGQAATYFEEQGQLLRSSRSVKALGPDLFGDRISHYDGGLEFVQTDVNLVGSSSLSISVGRRFASGPHWSMASGHFGRWDLEIPRVQGVFAASKGFVSGPGTPRRCSEFSPPPSAQGFAQEGIWLAKEYWRGIQLYVPGGGSKEILKRGPGSPQGPADQQSYPLLTKDYWQLRCIPLANGASPDSEGFLAISPDGTQYRFDWMAARPVERLERGTALPEAMSARSRALAVSGSGNERRRPTRSAEYFLNRSEHWIMPTLVQDRFGNRVTYTYDPANPMHVDAITSSDGRTLRFTYVQGSNRIDSVTDGKRTWRYVYDGVTGDLTAVVQPDDSRWGFTVDSALFDPAQMYLGSPSCSQSTNEYSGGTIFSRTNTLRMTHPSGAQGLFVVAPVEHARGNVYSVCWIGNGGVNFPSSPPYFAKHSIQSKEISGPGMPTMRWSYAYSPSAGQGSVEGCSGNCPSTKWVQINEPSGRFTRMTFGIRAGGNEGLLLKSEDFDAQGVLKRSVTQSYRAYDAGPYPTSVGQSIQPIAENYTNGRLQPLEARETSQQGVAFAWRAIRFDTLGRSLQVTKSGPAGSRTETTTLIDLSNPWVLGLTESVTFEGVGVSVFNTYDSLGRKTSDKVFGVPQFSYGYNADGSLAWKQDGRGNRTRYDDYKLGLPRLVSYADGSSEAVTVDELGFITSHRTAANYTTAYGYDLMGRLNLVTPPSGFASTSLNFEQVASAEYGVPAGHWRQTVTKGNAKTITLLDALWRPVMTRSFDASQEAATRKVVVKGYDVEGHLSFESYPARDYASVAVTSPGKRMSYDALGRMTLTEQDSELGVLQTRQDYQSGFVTAITNPRGKVTTQRFWALDNPTEASLAQIDLPEGVQVQINRNVLGKPTSITRGGGGVSVTRSYVYDAGRRLCKTVEPEVGATLQDYDAAGNLAWRAPGLALTSGSSCDTASVAAAAKISYTYDAVNQLTATSYGDGSPGITRSYWDDGKPKSVSSAGTVWNYSYNALRQLETEVLSFGGKTFGFSRSYNLAGDLAGLVYPASNGTPGPALNFSPNALGEPSVVSGYASQVSFHPNGAVAGYTLANGVVHTVSQNLRGLPSQNSDSGVLNDVYAYDANGNVVGITDQQESVFNRSMSYDGLDRLTGTSAPGVWGTASYTYDAVDNLRTAVVGSRNATLNYADGRNRLSSITVNGSTSNYSYDPYGNITGKGGQTFSFDQGNRLSASSLGGGYVYDGLGRRVQVVTKAGETRLQVYSQDGQLLWSTTPGGSVPASIVGYTCPPGTTLSGTSCVGTTTKAATPTYACDSGYTLSGSSCSKSVVETKAATQTQVCPGGMTLQAGQCVGTATEPATLQYSCPDTSWTLSGSTCSRTTTATQAATETLSCTRGTLVGGQCQVPDSKPATPVYGCPDTSWTLSGSSCSKTVPDDYAATVSGYTCPSGGTLSGSSCVVSSSVPATPSYNCAGVGSLSTYNGMAACVTPSVYANTGSEAPAACSDEYGSYGLSYLGAKQTAGKLWACAYQPKVTGYSCSSGTLQGSQCVSSSSYGATPTYNCPSGGTLDGSMCRRSKLVTQAASVSGYSCQPGYTLSGTTCNGYVYEAPVKRYSCPSADWTLSGTTCSKTTAESQGASPRYTCRSGWTLSGQTCSTSTTQAPTTQYSCDSGWTLSGSSCSRTTVSTVGARITGYTCDTGYTLQADNTCKTSSSTPATPKYGCPDGSSSTAGGTCPSGVQGTAYIYLGNKLIAETVVGGSTQYVHTDALGSPVARTGPTKALISRTRYEPYGYVAAGAKPSASTSQVGFTGHVQDAETELVYMQQRYYDPIAGRFLSVDPIVTDANTGKGFGLYTYVDNNPYTKVDPDGREPEMHRWADPKGMTHAEATSGLRMAGEVALSMVPGASSVEYASNGQLGMAAAMLVVDLGPAKVLKAAEKVVEATKGVKAVERTGASKMQKAVERGQAPKGIERVDKAHDAPGAKDHVHFKDGTSMNHDGTIHDAHKGTPSPTNKESKWLENNGWTGKPEGQ
ncbi:RHS repeat-associated core domain-containing protein [Mitsuaria sp. WAJ17]|uniref:RHS repeat-associated core domain-containing protein n=1 Tax=Mitsuaria sp. WAJ17 TaxID=2761452 RepID=UPI0016025D4C|nr:RHS repeat-associated core domain-containing protein [Mitsuaria sp. WAJ17]MBB2486349.1 RHS repeat-associated core domain-containing protein [Mitsuaria sp. WAJ17]